ncbi:MAG: xaa-Pro aminopeptidase [Alphaproteobacteria bacterium]|nr:xaa-Pro aminopeptidase [Alphaproteobacteria bacterium]
MTSDEKINRLRQWMRDNGIDAYLVPHADRFQSEYLVPQDERLAWLTGFTGSAGMAAILSDKAFLFTDGRYTLQAAAETDAHVIEVIESPAGNPADVFGGHLSEGGVIGFDPMLFTVAQMTLWRREAQLRHWQLRPLETNPIDLLWTDKPVAPTVPAKAHELAYAGMSTADKTARILEKRNPKAATILISDPTLVCWLLNMRGGDVAHVPLVQGAALLDETGHITLFTNPDKIPADLRLVWGNHVGVENLSRLTETIEKINKPLQIDPVQCSYAIKVFCDDRDIPLVEAQDPALLLRACKNAVEIKGAISAHEKDAMAFDAFMAWFNTRDFEAENITELDVIEKLRHCRTGNTDCVDDSFSTIAGFGPNGAIVHYRADEKTNRRLQPNSLLLLDSGGQYFEGTTDVTRVLPVGTPTPIMKKHYTAVLQGLIALSCTRFPVGTTGAQLEAIARQPVWALGLDYAHGTGHGVGSYLSVHEGPQGFSPRGTAPLQPGMILSIEPGVYLTGQYGIRLENLVAVVDDAREDDIKHMLAFKTLTKIPFESKLICREDLTEAEKEFLQKFQQ